MWLIIPLYIKWWRRCYMHTVTTYRAYSGSFSVRLHITVNIIMCLLWNILFLRIIAFVTVISFLSLCLTGCRCIILYFFVVCAFYCYIFSCNNLVTRFCSYRNCSVFYSSHYTIISDCCNTCVRRWKTVNPKCPKTSHSIVSLNFYPHRIIRRGIGIYLTIALYCVLFYVLVCNFYFLHYIFLCSKHRLIKSLFCRQFRCKCIWKSSNFWIEISTAYIFIFRIYYACIMSCLLTCQIFLYPILFFHIKLHDTLTHICRIVVGKVLSTSGNPVITYGKCIFIVETVMPRIHKRICYSRFNCPYLSHTF